MLEFISQSHVQCALNAIHKIAEDDFSVAKCTKCSKRKWLQLILTLTIYIVMHTDKHTHSERDAADSESNDRKCKLKNIYIFKRCLKINAIDFICFNFVQFIQLQQSCIHFTRNHESIFISLCKRISNECAFITEFRLKFFSSQSLFFFTNINQNE